MSVAVDGGRDDIVGGADGKAMRASLSGNTQEFLRWWGDELAAMTPGWLRHAFFPRAAVATITEVDGHFVIQQPNAKPRTLAPAPGKRRATVGGASIVLLLPNTAALLREKKLPGASRAHVQSIMDLQIASETPFTADEIYSDTRIVGEDDATQELSVSQAIAPRAAIDDIITRVSNIYGIRLAGVDIAAAPGSGVGQGFNILPVSMRAPSKAANLSLNRLLLVLLAGSAIFAGWAWRDLQERRLAAADAALSLTEVQAEGALEVYTLINSGIEGIKQLDAASNDPLRFAQVYETVASLLPEGAWLDEFTYSRPFAELSGLAGSSAMVIEQLEGSDLIASAKFVSPVVTDPQSGAERFRLRVEFEAPVTTGEAS